MSCLRAWVARANEAFHIASHRLLDLRSGRLCARVLRPCGCGVARDGAEGFLLAVYRCRVWRRVRIVRPGEPVPLADGAVVSGGLPLPKLPGAV